MLPVNRYLETNMTYYQKSYSLPLKGLRPVILNLTRKICCNFFCLIQSQYINKLCSMHISCSNYDIDLVRIS